MSERAKSCITAGRRLSRVQIAALAAAGLTSVPVRAPRLRLVRARPGLDAVIDQTVAYIAAAIESEGGVAMTGEASGGLQEGMTRDGADAVIVIGGTGSGRHDATVRTLASVGEVRVHGVALLPAETAAFGTVGARPVLALPGRLDAALAAWHLLGRCLLARLASGSEPLPLRTAKLTHKVSSPVGLAELVPVRCAGFLATPIASGYVPLAALAQADGWILSSLPAKDTRRTARS